MACWSQIQEGVILTIGPAGTFDSNGSGDYSEHLVAFATQPG